MNTEKLQKIITAFLFILNKEGKSGFFNLGEIVNILKLNAEYDIFIYILAKQLEKDSYVNTYYTSSAILVELTYYAILMIEENEEVLLLPLNEHLKKIGYLNNYDLLSEEISEFKNEIISEINELTALLLKELSTNQSHDLMLDLRSLTNELEKYCPDISIIQNKLEKLNECEITRSYYLKIKPLFHKN